MKYFTYVQGTRGPEPQFWYGELTDGGGKAKPCLMKPIQMHPNDARTLERCALDYPIEVEK